MLQVKKRFLMQEEDDYPAILAQRPRTVVKISNDRDIELVSKALVKYRQLSHYIEDDEVHITTADFIDLMDFLRRYNIEYTVIEKEPLNPNRRHSVMGPEKWKV